MHKLRRQKRPTDHSSKDDIDRGTDFINDDVVSSQKFLKCYFINLYNFSEISQQNPIYEKCPKE